MDNTVINELAERGKKRGSPLTGTEVLTALEGVDSRSLKICAKSLKSRGSIFPATQRRSSSRSRIWMKMRNSLYWKPILRR